MVQWFMCLPWDPQNPHKCWVGMVALLWFQRWKADTGGPQSKLASTSSYVGELWFWRRYPVSMNGAEQQRRMTPDISFGSQHTSIHTCASTYTSFTCKYAYMYAKYAYTHMHPTHIWKWKNEKNEKKWSWIKLTLHGEFPPLLWCQLPAILFPCSSGAGACMKGTDLLCALSTHRRTPASVSFELSLCSVS